MSIVGLDEVGRGCWAGPLVAAAVVLNPLHPILGLQDSKKLRAAQRIMLDAAIRSRASAIGIGWVWPAAIDTNGLTVAVRSAMEQAMLQVVAAFGTVPNQIIIDGNYNYLPAYDNVQTVVRADGSIAEASAASIIAKVARDSYMIQQAAVDYPDYGFERHVGYGTALHITMIKQHGITPIHRMSYKPIKALAS